VNESNLKTVERIYEAAGRLDRQVISTLFSSSTEIVQPETLPWGGKHKGLLGIFQAFVKMNYHIYQELKVEDLFEQNNSVVMVGRVEGKVKRNGQDFSVRAVHIWTFEDGKPRRMEEFMDTAPLLELLNTK
jgi:ketosteroid isomerase-like protein